MLPLNSPPYEMTEKKDQNFWKQSPDSGVVVRSDEYDPPPYENTTRTTERKYSTAKRKAGKERNGLLTCHK